jgi:hypothetical protein
MQGDRFSGRINHPDQLTRIVIFKPEGSTGGCDSFYEVLAAVIVVECLPAESVCFSNQIIMLIIAVLVYCPAGKGLPDQVSAGIIFQLGNIAIFITETRPLSSPYPELNGIAQLVNNPGGLSLAAVVLQGAAFRIRYLHVAWIC